MPLIKYYDIVWHDCVQNHDNELSPFKVKQTNHKKKMYKQNVKEWPQEHCVIILMFPWSGLGRIDGRVSFIS